MRAIVSVIDMRCNNLIRLASKDFDDFEDCIKWVRHFKNLRYNGFTLIKDGKAETYRIYTTVAWNKKYGKRDCQNGWNLYKR